MAVIVFDKDKLTKKIEPTHSRKLEYAIRDFITKCGGSYYDDELSEGVLTSYYQTGRLYVYYYLVNYT